MRLIALCLLLNMGLTQAQKLPNMNWKHAGFNLTAKADLPIVDFQEVRSSFSADLSNDLVIQQIIKENSEGAIIYFNAGEYLFREQIKLPSHFILRGASHASVLIFDLNKEQDCILAKGQITYQKFEVASDLRIGDSLLKVVSASGIAEGELYYLSSRDNNLVHSNWAIGKTGQLLTIQGIDGNYLHITEIRRNHLLIDQPVLTKVAPVQFIGVENLTIINQTKTEQQTSNIKFEYASNCWVDGVHSLYANYSHILLEFSANCVIGNCIIEKAHDYGSGGKGYGITFQFGTSECVAGDNYCDSLRHAFLLQAGANGNVISRNHSQHVYWTNVRLPADAAGDIVFHGNYPYANLVQWNECNTIVFDHSHGANGKNNLVFSNHLMGYGIYCSGRSKHQAFVDNKIEKSRWPKGRYRVKGTHFECNNAVGQKVKPKKSVDCSGQSDFYR